MSLKRRQLLIGMSALGGFSLSACIRAVTSVESVKFGSATPVAASPDPPASPDLLAQVGLVNPPRGDVRLVVISDLNGSYGSTTYDAEVEQAIALIPAWQPDLVIGGGDMVAGQSRQLSKPAIEAMWAGFDRAIAAPLRKANLPFGFTIGNHDASRAMGSNGMIFEQERDLASAYWNDPTHDPGLEFIDRAKFPFYYSFQKNGIFFLTWDASSSLPMLPEDRAWVEQSLGSEVAQAAPMRIVLGHLPLYAVAEQRDKVGEVLEQADELRSLLERYQVHSYISGHHHAYYPGHRGKLELLHAGALGSGPRPLLSSPLPPRKTLTVVDINLNAAVTNYTTYDMQQLKVIDQNELPKIIVGHNGMVLRRDIGWDDLTPTEQSTCTQRHPLELCS